MYYLLTAVDQFLRALAVTASGLHHRSHLSEQSLQFFDLNEAFIRLDAPFHALLLRCDFTLEFFHVRTRLEKLLLQFFDLFYPSGQVFLKGDFLATARLFLPWTLACGLAYGTLVCIFLFLFLLISRRIGDDIKRTPLNLLYRFLHIRRLFVG